jgi:hypothetical protein
LRGKVTSKRPARLRGPFCAATKLRSRPHDLVLSAPPTTLPRRAPAHHDPLPQQTAVVNEAGWRRP